MDDKASSLTTVENVDILKRVLPALENISEWNHDGIAETLKTFCEESDLKLGKVAQPIRAALTGRTTSPGVFDVMAVLSKDECLARLADQKA